MARGEADPERQKCYISVHVKGTEKPPPNELFYQATGALSGFENPVLNVYIGDGTPGPYRGSEQVERLKRGCTVGLRRSDGRATMWHSANQGARARGPFQLPVPDVDKLDETYLHVELHADVKNTRCEAITETRHLRSADPLPLSELYHGRNERMLPLKPWGGAADASVRFSSKQEFPPVDAVLVLRPAGFGIRNPAAPEDTEWLWPTMAPVRVSELDMAVTREAREMHLPSDKQFWCELEDAIAAQKRLSQQHPVSRIRASQCETVHHSAKSHDTRAVCANIKFVLAFYSNYRDMRQHRITVRDLSQHRVHTWMVSPAFWSTLVAAVHLRQQCQRRGAYNFKKGDKVFYEPEELAIKIRNIEESGSTKEARQELTDAIRKKRRQGEIVSEGPLDADGNPHAGVGPKHYKVFFSPQSSVKKKGEIKILPAVHRNRFAGPALIFCDAGDDIIVMHQRNLVKMSRSLWEQTVQEWNIANSTGGQQWRSVLRTSGSPANAETPPLWKHMRQLVVDWKLLEVTPEEASPPRVLDSRWRRGVEETASPASSPREGKRTAPQ
eukprot:TRINITY_DN61981_c0_g1_i1.p1 TRINITY_DN61981_c0_g1~~TRINITY_DN61981_c0_g1_i1.p1  ORF type:complete len:577 (+),score=118.12 TRINITY_DN61981_c0_g1_i1:66-1733(+)